MKINSVSNLSVLCARINNLNDFKSQKENINNKELMSSNASLAFRAQVLYGYRRPVMNNADTKIVYDKILQVLKKLPDSARMTKPILVKSGKESYGFTWDKSEKDKFKLTVKNNIKTAEDWTKADATRSVISCLFDANGIMQVGELTKPIKSDYSQGVFYHNAGKLGRRIRIDDITLRPTTVNHNIWTVMPEFSTKNASGDIDLYVKLKNVVLSDMFIEFTRKKTSILV